MITRVGQITIAVALCTTGCASPFPTSRGQHFLRPLTPEQPGYWTTLQVHWLGSASYLLQLGDVSILTDPYYTYPSMLQIVGGEIHSDPVKVDQILSNLPVADAIFIGHSHYDHMLDLAEVLRRPAWRSAPVIGSQTTRNILAGYDGDLTARWNQVEINDEWTKIAPGIEYKALATGHAPNFQSCGISILVYDGKVKSPLECPPRFADDFKRGETYSFLFRLSNDHVEGILDHQRRSYLIYFAGAVGTTTKGVAELTPDPVDVAILCVPAWRYVQGYPDDLLDMLKPSTIVASHYDDMFQSGPGPRGVVMTAHLPGFVRRVNELATYPTFVQFLVPDVGEVMQIRKP